MTTALLATIATHKDYQLSLLLKDVLLDTTALLEAIFQTQLVLQRLKATYANLVTIVRSDLPRLFNAQQAPTNLERDLLNVKFALQGFIVN